MKLIYFILFVTIISTVGCKEAGSTADSSSAKPIAGPIATPTPTPSQQLQLNERLAFFGDNFVYASDAFRTMLGSVRGASQSLNYGRQFDGSNGAMIGGFQALGGAASAAITTGDKVIYMAGIYDSKWYGADDPGNQAKNYLKSFLNELLSNGVKVYIGTVPRLPAIGYTTGAPINLGSDAAANYYSNVVRNAVAEIGSPNITIVEVNMLLPAQAQYFNAGGTALSQAGNELVVQLFMDAMGSN